MSGALDGLLVIALEQAVAAPLASSRLADAGARVIKVERPEGDFARDYDTLVEGQSAYFVWLNRGKESLCLDLKAAADRQLLLAMIAKADIIVQNLKPGSLTSLGIDLPRLHREFPRLISCSISGFGTTGPLADRKAYDLIVQAEAGLCAITGTPEGPARVGVSVCDIAAGMNAHAAIVQALFDRERTGKGAAIEVSLFDALAEWMNVPYLQWAYGGREVERAGVNHSTLAPYGAYTCGDGTAIIFSVQNQREWRSFCQHFLQDQALAIDPRFATNMDRLANRNRLDEIVQARFAGLDADSAARLLEASAIAHGRLNDIVGLARHAHLRTVAIDTPGGPIDVIAPAPMVAGLNPAFGAVPGLGQHSERLRAEFSRGGPG